MSKIAKGTWVEIEQVVLNPEERAASLPEETLIARSVQE